MTALFAKYVIIKNTLLVGMPEIFRAKRKVYIPAKFYTRPSAYKMALLLADTRHTTTLAIYVSKVFALRNELN